MPPVAASVKWKTDQTEQVNIGWGNAWVVFGVHEDHKNSQEK